MVVAGISLLIKPEIIFDWISNNMDNTLLYIAAIVVRLFLGILFIATSRESKHPKVFKTLAYVFILAAVVFILIGQENFQHFISSVIPTFKPFAPVAGLLSSVFGGFILYAFLSSEQ